MDRHHPNLWNLTKGDHYFFLFTLVICIPKAYAQTEKAPHFLGINPGVTVEPFYEKGELDVNIFPLVYQRPVSLRMDPRLTTILNLGVRNSGNEISQWGLEAALPVFLKRKDSKTEYSKGFYVSPVAGVTRNSIEAHNTVGLWLEPGYNLLFDDKFALSFGLQVGGTFFSYDNDQKKWRSHFGVKIIFGRWI